MPIDLRNAGFAAGVERNDFACSFQLCLKQRKKMLSEFYYLRLVIILLRHPTALTGLSGGLHNVRRALTVSVRNNYSKSLANVVEVRGMVIHVNPTEVGMSAWISGGAWEPQITSLFECLLKRGMTVVDPGANVGYYTLMSARLVGQDGVVYAFEPNPVAFSMLVRSVEANGFTNIILSNQAVTDSEGLSPFYSTDQTSMSSLVRNRGKGKMVVRTQSIDSLDLPSIDILRLTWRELNH